MTRPKILVIGATGKTGAAVVQQLREKDWPVRAIVHRADARSEQLQRSGAEIVAADIFDFDQLSAAMRGARRAYYCPPCLPYMIQSVAAFAAAAQEMRLESITGLSQWLAGPAHPSLMSRQHWLADRVFSMIPGVAHTIVNPGFFATAYLSLIPFAAQLGVFPLPVDGESRNAPPSNEDIARVAVTALIDPDRHAGKSYRPTGPKLLSVNEMVGVLSRVLNRKVRHIQTPMWMFYKAVRQAGMPPLLLSGFRHYFQDHNRGAFEFGAPTDDVFEVTGRRPESFETIARRYAALPEARQTWANTLRAFAGFLTTPFRPGFNPEKFEREQFHPIPPAPRLALDSERWRREHNGPPPTGQAQARSIDARRSA